MDNSLDEIVQKRFAQIKRMAIMIFGGLILLLVLLVIVDLPFIDGLASEIWIASLIVIPTVTICGLLASRLYKFKWIKAKVLGKGPNAIDKIKIERASVFYLYCFYASFATWFNLGVWSLMGTVFLGGKYWLAIYGIPAIAMMVITWPKKDDLINFLKVD